MFANPNRNFSYKKILIKLLQETRTIKQEHAEICKTLQIMKQLFTSEELKLKLMAELPIKLSHEFSFDNPPASPSLVTLRKEGFLLKRGVHNTSFKKRWFVFDEGNRMVYFKNENKLKALNIVDLTLADIEPTNSNIHFCFSLVTPTRTFELQALNETEWNQWTAFLTAYFEKMKAKKMNNPFGSQRPHSPTGETITINM